MNTIADKIENAFAFTKTVIEGACDMLKELSTPLAAAVWAFGAFIACVWCVVIAKVVAAPLGLF